MSVKDLIASVPPGEPYFSCEFFPPKTKSGFENLTARIERMVKLGPLFVNVTWGAGGSTAEKSLELARSCQQLGVPTCLHLTCTNMDKHVLDDALRRAKQIGIRSILALRGDPPRDDEYWVPGSGEFEHAIDLVHYIKKHHGDHFSIGVAGYPEGHSDGYADEQNPEKDLPFLIEKVEAGADFIVTQLFYDVDKFVEYEKMIRSSGSELLKSIPLIPGLMPVNTKSSFLRAAKLGHASIPAKIYEKLSRIDSLDDESIKQFGVELLADMIHEIRERTQDRVKGFHFYTLNLEKSIALILEKSHLVKTEIENSEIAVDAEFLSADAVQEKRKKATTSSRKSSQLFAHNRIIDGETDDNADLRVSLKDAEQQEPDSAAILAISTGEGSLGREATWDDFPNGRFGDSRSPAYGEVDGYGPSLHTNPKQALKLWGYPVDQRDVTQIFVRHITNELDLIPFSDQALSPETGLIQEELLQLNQKGYWTVASQPAANCIPSDDKIFGWGPKGGQVFQKAFVEFFISPDAWSTLKKRLDALDDAEISYFATTQHGPLSSKMPIGCHSNAVTWGVFPSREVVQSTIIEEESFLAWRDESFSIWKEWQHLYPTKSASAKFLGSIHDSYYLVSIVHHNYFEENALWTLLQE